MKHTSFALVLICILITVGVVSSCQTTATTPEPTTTSTIKPTKETTDTSAATITPSPSFTISPTITPSPTITLTHTPDYTETTTPYPTLLVRNIVRATPAQHALCPVENPDLEFDPESIYWRDPSTLSSLLSRKASFSQIKRLLDNAGYGDTITLRDVTNDGVNELIYLLNNTRLKIISCEEGEYVTILDTDGSCINIVAVEDMNLNGIRDVLFSYADSYPDVGCDGRLGFDVYEWDGQTMQQMEDVYHGDVENLELLFYTETMHPNTRLLRGLFFHYPFDWGPDGIMLGDVKIDVVDLDYNGTKEIRMKYTDPDPYMQDWRDEPLRTLTLVFEWNGEKYLFSDAIFGPPEYRFQAVQDADRYFLMRQYDKALAMYDEVINSTTLKTWSKEYMAYLDDLYFSENFSFKSDPPTKPEMTLDEYQQLSAYARYRIMMIQLAQGNRSDAYTSYQLLDQIYMEDNPGYAHAEIGLTYWYAVAEGQTLVEACHAVKDYMEENPDLLPVFGDGQHGEQSHHYSMNDICPLDEIDVKLLSGEGE